MFVDPTGLNVMLVWFDPFAINPPVGLMLFPTKGFSDRWERSFDLTIKDQNVYSQFSGFSHGYSRMTGWAYSRIQHNSFFHLREILS